MGMSAFRCRQTTRLAGTAIGLAAATPLFFASTAGAQVQWLNGPSEITRQLSGEQLSQKLTEAAQRAGATRVLVRVKVPITDAHKVELAKSGLTFLDYVGDNAYFASIDHEALETGRIVASNLLASVQPVNDQWKLHPDLAAGIIRPWSIVGEHMVARFDGDKVAPGTRPRFEMETDVAVYVNFHKDVDVDLEGAGIIRAVGGQIRSVVRSTNMIVAHLPVSRIDDLAKIDGVMYVEPPLPLLTELNAENRVLTHVDQVNTAPYNLSGAGVNVLVFDGGKVRATHLGYTNPPIIGASDTAGVSDHATHVAGTIGGGDTGAPGIDPTERGMAPNVQIISYGFEQPGGLTEGFLYTDPGDLEDDYTEAITLYGADLSNNSIGTNTAPNGFPCDWEGNYNNTSILIDSIVRGSLGAPFRVVWANGNERQVSTCGSTYHTTAPPACAKNHITVGALNSDTDLNASFTSWGPSDDDRMKPDISAPGCQVGGDGGVRSLGSGSDTAYSVKCGTSMASPTVAGICALILEDWRNLYPTDPDPRNSTFKALLAHTAVDIEEAGPDYKTGYGSVRADAAIDQLRTGFLFEADVDQSSSYFATVIVGPGDTELKVTMAWDDAPSTPLAAPVLVNDLDLVVLSPTGVRAYPWTLGGLASPGSLAIQSMENHVDNIEQVFVQNPQQGAWLVEVRGTNVPQGPQPFSLVASPFLVNCSDAGVITMNGSTFNCADSITLTTIDCGLNTSDAVVDTVTVLLESTSEPGGEMVLLTETDPASAKFTASIATSTSDAPGVLLVANGDTITATYNDADDGTGSPAVSTKNASVDCAPPVISNVVVADVQPREATITFDTNEATTATIFYGTACGALSSMEVVLGSNTSHSVLITGLTDQTDYFFAIEATDAAGNTALDDNGATCYTFTTPDIPDFFTEQFASGSDLNGMALFLAPAAGVDQYVACAFPISGFPTDPAGGTTIAMSDDDSENVVLSGATVSLYGTSYNNVWFGSNGYITLGASDTTYTETPTDHFDTPRVAALFDDLNPSTGGTVSWKQEADRAVFTWNGVPQFSNSDSNSFQIEMFFDGTIQISWVSLSSGDFIAGISSGAGLDPDFLPSDLSAYTAGCGPRPPSAGSASYNAAAGVPFPVTLQASDDGAPGPLSYTITSLPTEPLRDAGTNLLITSVPHTLGGGANQVIYEPGSSFVGVDSFTFIADDGGLPPDGGPSGTGTVSFAVEGTLPLPFFDDFPATSFDPIKWTSVLNATIDTVGIAEPSAPNSARFNGNPTTNGDVATTALLNAAGYTDLVLSFWYQETGGGETPDSGDDLIVSFQDDQGAWIEVARFLGSMPSMSTFLQQSINLPASASHAQLRIRFQSNGTGGAFDDWFVDDIGLDGTAPASCLGDADGNGQVDLGDVNLVLFSFGRNPSTPGTMGDVDGDGDVDLNDLNLVLFNFGLICP